MKLWQYLSFATVALAGMFLIAAVLGFAIGG